MPRKGRVKHSESIYHIISRSVSEFLLFRDNADKEYYLELLKRYTGKFQCSLYAYCLMDNHLHLHLDPRGYDISKFMHCTHVAYVRYYNKKYGRHGPVFQERFESRILDTDAYNLTVSAYIHNNAKDIEGYRGKEHLYPYSSYGIYLGIRKDPLHLVDKSFIMDLFHTRDEKRFSERYQDFVAHQNETGIGRKKTEDLSKALENEYISGRQVILREKLPSRVIAYITDRLLGGKGEELIIQSGRRLSKYRTFCAYVMRVLCGMRYKEICQHLYNITVSGCSALCSRGFELVCGKGEYRRIFEELLAGKAA